MWKYIKRFLVGKPLKTVDEGNQQLSRFKALALLSSDALSSVAYGTETITTALMAAGALALWLQLPVAMLVLILLMAIVISYRQIIHAYPSGGGAYAVASQNWGPKAGLVAGGSLLVDYMLTVAVSAAAAADAITSALPQLGQHNVLISVIIILILTAMNLRGLRESANFLTIPVYFFIVMTIVMIVYGIYQLFTGQIEPQPTAPVGMKFSGLSIILFMRAFSGGSSSLTGVEAISNAVPNFRLPKEKNAAATLAMMATILAIFFAGITTLSYQYGIIPKADQTVLSQIAQHTFGGRNVGYFLVQLSTAMILAVAANTGFSAFPMLAFNLAKDKYMPHLYMDRGDRLGYSNGIISLALGAIALLLIFKGSTDSLIPLYAVGVFVPFTLSQSGMIRYWNRTRPVHWQFKAIINSIGALISAVLVITIFALRFNQIWPYIVIMPILIKIFLKIRSHYASIAKQLHLTNAAAKKVQFQEYDGAMVVILVSSVTQAANEAIRYAESIGDQIVAVHVSFDENPKKEAENRREFKRKYPQVRYIDIHSSYRSLAKPARDFIRALKKQADKTNHSLTVLLPQFVPRKPWQNILHNQNSLRLRQALSSDEDITISTYYYHLRD